MGGYYCALCKEKKKPEFSVENRKFRLRKIII
jgi:hypothetical protein